MIGNVILPIFFLYFVIVSGYCSSLLNCGLQRYMAESIFMKHFLIFLSIYIFTYVLNWYTFDSLAVEQENFESNNVLKNSSLKQLGKWFVSSLGVYILFLVSTKSEVSYILIFFVYTIIAILLQIIIKSLSSEEYNHLVGSLFITENDYQGKNKEIVKNLHNIVSSGFLVTILLLFIGFYKYYARHRIEYAREWDFVKFMFGTNSCRMSDTPV